MKGKFILSCAFSRGNVNNFKKIKQRSLRKSKQKLKMSSPCLSRGVAHMGLVSVLSENQAQHGD